MLSTRRHSVPTTSRQLSHQLDRRTGPPAPSLLDQTPDCRLHDAWISLSLSMRLDRRTTAGPVTRRAAAFAWNEQRGAVLVGLAATCPSQSQRCARVAPAGGSLRTDGVRAAEMPGDPSVAQRDRATRGARASTKAIIAHGASRGRQDLVRGLSPGATRDDAGGARVYGSRELLCAQGKSNFLPAGSLTTGPVACSS